MKAVPCNETGSGKIKIIGVLAIIFVIISVFVIQQSTEKETIKIGAIVSLAGTGSHLVDLRDAMLMAADEIDSSGSGLEIFNNPLYPFAKEFQKKFETI